jgi:hypothetical protein
VSRLATLWRFALGAVRDPHSDDLSSARLWGGALILAAIAVAVYGVLQKQEYAATATGFAATGIGALASRTKAGPP